jgi:AcrR family transcriptional regulator
MLSNEKKLDPRVMRTRSVLREALMVLITEIGYDAITVQHITDRARLNRATFYLHYRDKQDLLTQIIKDVLEELTHTPNYLQSVEPIDTRALFTYYFDHVAKHAAFYRVMLQEASVAPYVQEMQNHLESIARRWMLSGAITPETMRTPPELFISFIGSAYFNVIKWWVTNDQPYSSAYMAAQFMRLTLGGMQHEFGLTEVLAKVEAELNQHVQTQDTNKNS